MTTSLSIHFKDSLCRSLERLSGLLFLLSLASPASVTVNGLLYRSIARSLERVKDGVHGHEKAAQRRASVQVMPLPQRGETRRPRQSVHATTCEKVSASESAGRQGRLFHPCVRHEHSTRRRPERASKSGRYMVHIVDVMCGYTARKRPLIRQARAPCPRASLGVEQPMAKICVRLAPLPQVFRHAPRCWPSIGTTMRRISSWW